MKKLLLVIVVLLLGLTILSCKKREAVDPKNIIEERLEEEVNEKQPKKVFESSFSIDNISNTVLGYNGTYNGEVLELKIKNISKGIEKVKLTSITINGEHQSVVVLREKNNTFEYPKEDSFVVLMPENEKVILIKLFEKLSDNVKISEKEFDFPLMITFVVEEKITGTSYLQEFIINENGQILYENLIIIKNKKGSY
jgi:hypothetical protein